MIQWLYARKRLTFSLRLLTASTAKGDHLGFLKWLRANGCPWNWETCYNAAQGGHLEVLKWARANGCPWGMWTSARAAKGGHLEILKWARANGCPCDYLTCYNAALGGRLEVLKWAIANGCDWSRDDCFAIAYEAGNGTMDTGNPLAFSNNRAVYRDETSYCPQAKFTTYNWFTECTMNGTIVRAYRNGSSDH